MSGLLHPSSLWNEELVTNIFLLVDVDFNCCLRVSKLGVEDKLIWFYDKFVRYTTKSGYHVVKAIRDSDMSNCGGSESSMTANSLANKIWKLNVPNKIKHFV